MTATNALTPEPTLAAAIALAKHVGQVLAARGWVVATAESCTGGLVGHLLTEIPGSSAYVAGGAITYSNAAKERVLGVPHDALLAVGAVSAQVAQAMAQGARALYAADVAVAVTGIAGPGGGLPHKPTGSVYLHVSGPDHYERGEYHIWPYDRSGNKLASAVRALEMIGECATQSGMAGPG